MNKLPIGDDLKPSDLDKMFRAVVDAMPKSEPLMPVGPDAYKEIKAQLRKIR